MPIPDRQRERREYVRKKIWLDGNTIFWAVFFWSFLLVTVSLAVLCCVLLVTGLHDPFISSFVGVPAMLMIFGCYGCWILWRTLQTVKEMRDEIAYVPPVTPNTMPAEEILVRASQEPAQEQSAVLLRTAENADTPAEELLRASAGE